MRWMTRRQLVSNPHQRVYHRFGVRVHPQRLQLVTHRSLGAWSGMKFSARRVRMAFHAVSESFLCWMTMSQREMYHVLRPDLQYVPVH